MLIDVTDRSRAVAQARLRVRVAAADDAAAWRAYAERHPDMTVFHRWEWRDLLATAFGHEPHYLIAERGSRCTGVLPLARVRSWLFGDALVSLPFCSWAGPLADDGETARELLENAVTLAARLGSDRVEIREVGPSRGDWPNQDLYVRFVKAISADHDANLNAVPRKQRAMIRKGIRNGLTSHPGSVEDFYPLYTDNVHRHGTPACPRRFFEGIADAFGNDSEFLIVRDASGTPVSGVLSLHHRQEIFPFYAGDTVQARNLAANDFKYWEVMRRGAERGARTFDYGRSKVGTGSFDFKKNWGFTPTPLSYQFHLKAGQSIPQNNPMNPKFRLVIGTWRRLPRSIVNALGPRLVRGLG